MNAIWIIFRKEVIESVRHYRSWATGLFWALFGPLLMGGIFLLIGTTVRKDTEKPLNLPAQNAEAAPNLIQFLEQRGAVIQPPPVDPEAAVKSGDINVVLVIPADYTENFSSGKTATVELILDSSRQSAQVDVERLKNLLEGYSQY